MAGAHRVSLLLAISALLTASLHAPAVAVESAGQTEPWDVPGSEWAGTIETTIERTTQTDTRRRNVYEESATYTDLQSRSEDANGSYSARVRGSGTELDYMNVCGDQQLRLITSLAWTVDRDSGLDPNFPDIMDIETDETGRTTIAPRIVFTDVSYESFDCEGTAHPGTGSGNPVLAFDLGGGDGGPPPVVPDNDPDPLRLVGSRTWTLADPPTGLNDAHTAYSFTMDYDLTLKPPVGRCRTFNAAFVGKLDEIKMFRYALDDLRYCQGGGRGTIQYPGDPRSEPIYPAGFVAALDAVGITFRYDGSGAVRVQQHRSSAEAIVSGRYSYCMALPTNVLKKGVKVVLDRLPKAVRNRIYDWLDRGARFFVRKLYSRFVPGWVPKAVLNNGLDDVIERLPLSKRNKGAVLELVNFARGQSGSTFEDYLIGLVTDGICIPRVWTPEVTVSVPASGAPDTYESGPTGIFTVEPYTG